MKRNLFILILFIISEVAFSKNYKGAEIYSNQSYLYGRFEMKIKSAPGSGQLSTFFLYRNNSETATSLWQEIDIEIFGKDSNSFQSNVIVEAVEGKKLMTEQKHTTPNSLSADFHIYAIEWTPDSISWFLDDSLIRTEKTNAKLCNAAMSLRFNHWASNNVAWVGAFNKSVLPQYQYVDWIQYSSYTPDNGDNGTDFTFQWIDDFTSFDNNRWSKASWTFDGNLVDFLPLNAYTENGQLVLKLYDATPPTSINQPNGVEFDIFPNPFSESISINADFSKNYSLSIIQSYNNVILPISPLSENTATVVNNLFLNCKAGIYYLLLYQNGQLITTKKLIKSQ